MSSFCKHNIPGVSCGECSYTELSSENVDRTIAEVKKLVNKPLQVSDWSQKYKLGFYVIGFIYFVIWSILMLIK